MKVAFLTTDSREHFKDYGNPQPYFGTAPEALLEGFKSMPKDIEVHVISCLQRKAISSPAKLANNIHYHPLHVRNIGWMKTGYQGCIRAVRRKLREIRPDIVHGQGTERECALCAVFSGFPNVVTIHGVMRAIHKHTRGTQRFHYYWFARHLETLALRRTCGVIAISPYVEALAGRLSRSTWLIPNAVREPFFLTTSAREREPGLVRLVNVGVISPLKRQVELLEHLAGLRRAVPFEITFVGKASSSDAYAQRFARLIAALQVEHGGFKHVPFLEGTQLLGLYDSADAMVHFSKEESFGLTFAEALARNLPLFASDVGAIRQIGDGIPACRIFTTEDFPGLMSALKQWIETGLEIERPAAPQPLIKSRYHPNSIAEQHLEIYQGLAASC
jgi:glycosyltransferase involved in cell wall biosynthesis